MMSVLARAFFLAVAVSQYFGQAGRPNIHIVPGFVTRAQVPRLPAFPSVLACLY